VAATAEVRSVHKSISSPACAPSADLTGGRGAANDLPAELLAVLDAPSLDRLRELDPGGRMGLLTRVLLTFESSMGKLLAQLEQARGMPDLQVIKHVAHTMKSSSASVGALYLSELCADIERKVREMDTADLQGRVDAMVTECNQLQTRLKLISRA
jgi:HPt (histidine-containing phosphotransfer) domain-containing protein